MIIGYAYLWHTKHRRGQEEGLKERPCAVILVVKDDNGRDVVTVLPITHTEPSDPNDAIEIPIATKRRLGLDMERSWIILTELNRFRWPGPDLRPLQPGTPDSVVYGLLPIKLFEQVRRRFLELAAQRRISPVPRTE